MAKYTVTDEGKMYACDTAEGRIYLVNASAKELKYLYEEVYTSEEIKDRFIVKVEVPTKEKEDCDKTGKSK